MRIRTNKVILPLAVTLGLGLLLSCLSKAHAFNPITDVQDNLIWTLGNSAEIGTAYKLGGSGPVKDGTRGDSVMFGIFDYRFIRESYGAINDPNGGGKLGDGLKTGFQLNYFLGWFKSPQTEVMKALQNVNIGPVITTPVLSANRPFQTIDYWLEANWRFGK